MVKGRFDTSGNSSRDTGMAESDIAGHLTIPYPESLRESLVVAFLEIDEDQNIRFFNPGAERIFGYDRDEILGESLDFLIPPRFRDTHARYVRQFGSGPNVTRLEYMRPRITGRRADGSEFPAEVTIAKYETAAGPRLLAIVRDLDDEFAMRTDEDPGGMRALQALRVGERVLAKAASEQELREWLCLELARIPGYVFVWVGSADDDPDPVIRPVASSEPSETRFLPAIPVSAAEDESGPGLVQAACKTCKPVADHDLSRVRGFWPSGDTAEQRSCRSGVALPLFRGRRAFGIVCVAAGIHHAFDNRECQLLQAMADKVADGILTLRARDSGALDPEVIERLADIVAGTSDVIAFLDQEGNYLYLNPAGLRLIGTARINGGDPVPPSVIHSGPAAQEMLHRAIPTAVQTGSWNGSTVLVADGGTEISVSQDLFRHQTPDGDFLCVVALMRELTELEAHDTGADDAATTDDAADHDPFLVRGAGIGNVSAAWVAPLKIPVFHRDRILLLDVDEVAWMQADRHYARVTTADGSFLSSLGLVDLERRLDPARFARVHRSHIVNLRYALELERNHGHGYVVLDLPDRPCVPISRGNMEQVLHLFGLA